MKTRVCHYLIQFLAWLKWKQALVGGKTNPFLGILLKVKLLKRRAFFKSSLWKNIFLFGLIFFFGKSEVAYQRGQVGCWRKRRQVVNMTDPRLLAQCYLFLPTSLHWSAFSSLLTALGTKLELKQCRTWSRWTGKKPPEMGCSSPPGLQREDAVSNLSLMQTALAALTVQEHPSGSSVRKELHPWPPAWMPVCV